MLDPIELLDNPVRGVGLAEVAEEPPFANVRCEVGRRPIRAGDDVKPERIVGHQAEDLLQGECPHVEEHEVGLLECRRKAELERGCDPRGVPAACEGVRELIAFREAVPHDNEFGSAHRAF